MEDRQDGDDRTLALADCCNARLGCQCSDIFDIDEALCSFHKSYMCFGFCGVKAT
jgi:hypothetical protein